VTGKTVAIVQSSYIPWKGYFDLINLVDEFILYDDAQYTKRDWRNRNLIKTPGGAKWLTIPVFVKGKYLQRICETRVAEAGWPGNHWRSLVHNYSAAPHFAEFKERFEELYLGCREELLSLVNRRFIDAICSILGIETVLTWSMDYGGKGSRTERLVDLCRRAGATAYLSGPRAKSYMDEELFEQAGIALTYMDYSGYPEYPQLYPPFEHGLSVLDLIFNTGAEAPRYMKGSPA
jgi:WbqC-like protein family